MSFPDKPLAQLLGSNGPVHTISYSASPGTYVLTGSADRTIRLYNPFPSQSQTLYPSSSSSSSSYITKSSHSPSRSEIPQGRLIQTYSAHGYEVLSLAVSPNNEHFVSAGGDRSVFLWDVATATTIRRFGGNVHGHTSRINAVKFAGDDTSSSNNNAHNLVISGGFDTTVRIWDARSHNPKPIQVLDEARDAVTSLAVRGPEIVAGSVDGRVRAYDVRAGKCTVDVIGASVTSVDLTRDGRAMLVGGLDSKLRLMDRDRGTCLRTYADAGWRNEELRVQAVLGGREKFVVAGDDLTAGNGNHKDGTEGGSGNGNAGDGGGGGGRDRDRDGKVWAWDMLSGKVVATVRVPWGPPGHDANRKRVLGRDGKEKQRTNVISCLAWREDGWGDQFCAGGTSGVVTVFGQDVA